MIARVWHGYSKPEHADTYEAMLKPELLPGISAAKGYRGSYLLRREAGDEVEFITIMLWDSIDAIRAVAAAVLNAAKCCGAQYAQDEKKHPSANATAPHIHVQLVPGKRGGHGDLPENAKCKDCSKD